MKSHAIKFLNETFCNYNCNITATLHVVTIENLGWNSFLDYNFMVKLKAY